MSNWDKERLLRSSILAGFTSVLLGAAPALAQEAEAPVLTEEEEEEVEEEQAEGEDRIVVTGSRLQRSTFTSVSPIQVIEADVSREIGLVDPTAILQDSVAASDLQIDASFQGFVLDNGPGATTVNLRGLDPSRTLVLVNGRRLSPAGVEGAPGAPDITFIPGILVDRYELLLDGASSIYGSDAVAGVVNAILRTDFDGFEAEAFVTQPEHGGGEERRLGLAWGLSSDNGFAGFAAEYFKREDILFSDRSFTENCDRNVEITTDGEIRTFDRDLELNDLQRPTECKPGRLAGRFFIIGNGFGSVYAGPESNTGIPGFNESGLNFGGVPFIPDTDGDGFSDVNFEDYSLEALADDAQLIAGIEQFNFYSFGETSIDLFGGMDVFYEASYGFRRNELDSGERAQLFPVVPGSNPFNPCNPANPGGVNCNQLYNDFITSPEADAYFTSNFGAPATAFPFLFDDPAAAPNGIQPIVRVTGDRNLTNVEVEQMRLVGGFRGDLPFLDAVGPLSGWSYEVAGSYSRSLGTSERPGIRDDRLSLSLATSVRNPDGSITCGVVDGVVIDAACVPVNMFASSLYDPVVGDFETQAEREYVFGTRNFATTYEQSIVTAQAFGDIIDLPAGTVSAAIGYEYRIDELDSIPDDVAADGLFFGFFADQGASGSKDLHEAFAEVEIPLLAGQPLAEELTVNLSGRWTEEQFYGAAWTYSAKVGYRPVDWLLLRGTAGTSFRAPNLREQFLRGSTGFLNVTDPCIAPDEAIDDFTGDYDPTQDNRDPTVIDNCALDGLPADFGADRNGNQIVNVEVSSGGALDLNEETSESFTYGFVVEQPIFDQFDLTFSATYYSIEVEGSIAEPTTGFIIGDCYSNNPNLSSAFCSRITRGADGFIDLLDTSFININSDTAKGIDFNLLYQQDFVVFDRELGATVDVTANFQEERGVTIVGSDGTEQFDDNVGEFGLPEWNGFIRLGLTYQDFGFTWSTRYLGEVSQDEEFVDAFGNITGDPAFASTCLGEAAGDVNCRDVGFADEYFRHDMSLTYDGGDWFVRGGVRNVFDEEPPLVDGNEILARRNYPVGAGYDAFGRTFFMNVGKEF